jgi:hypothetical protein
MELPTDIVKEASVRDFMSQRMLESVLEIGEEPRFVEELGGLEMGEERV